MDYYLIFAAVLLIPVVWLLRFTGCTTFGTTPTDPKNTTPSGTIVKRINCGGPTVGPATGETLGWEADTATAGTAGFGQVGRQKVTDDGGALAGDVYETWRIGPSGTTGLPYSLTLPEGDYKVTLKFARLDSNINVGGKFLVQLQNDVPFFIDAAESIHPLSRKFDHPEQAVHVDSSGKLTITFQINQQVGGGTFPFINAIEVRK
jgi:hypothetical protein